MRRDRVARLTAGCYICSMVARLPVLLAGFAVLGTATDPAPAAAQVVAAQDALAGQADAYLRGQMARIRIPGLQVAVIRAGRIALLRSYGVASVELGTPVTDRTVFAINSMAKAFTGVAVMRLVEAGRLDLSAPVGAYLDDLPEAWRAVTIRQLLSHMSGLPDVMRAPTVETDQDPAWAWVRQQPVLFAAGERFHYCQTNYSLIQQVIARLEGTRWDAPPAAPQIAELGLSQTSYGDSTDLVPDKGPTYRFVRSAAPSPAILRPAIERFLPFRHASSGLNSTATDLARWVVALRSERLLSRASLETMWTPSAFNDGRPGQWGLGWQVLQRGNGRAVGMTGGGRAALFIYPEHDVAVIILTNLAGAFPEDMVDQIASLYAPDLHLTGVPALRVALEARGYARAAEAAAEIARADPALRWSETELNDWGYRLLSTGRPAEALEIMKLVLSLFPQSGNAHDSLAEAYAANGEHDRAIAHYRRSLELDPGNANAVHQIERLTAQPSDERR